VGQATRCSAMWLYTLGRNLGSLRQRLAETLLITWTLMCIPAISFPIFFLFVKVLIFFLKLAVTMRTKGCCQRTHRDHPIKARSIHVWYFPKSWLAKDMVNRHPLSLYTKQICQMNRKNDLNGVTRTFWLWWTYGWGCSSVDKALGQGAEGPRFERRRDKNIQYNVTGWEEVSVAASSSCVAHFNCLCFTVPDRPMCYKETLNSIT
jgi:hypothetical protein